MNDLKLTKQIDRQAKRMKTAEHERPTLISQTVFTGTLGLMFVLPVIAGAYFGHWLDKLQQGYSIRWTMGMIMLGVIAGAVNVILFIRERD